MMTPGMPNADDFHEYKRLILARLDAQDEQAREFRGEMRTELRELSKTLNRNHTDIALLKLKSGLWGAGAGFVAGLSHMFSQLLKGH